jgi:predicted nucleic acid-binding protein
MAGLITMPDKNILIPDTIIAATAITYEIPLLTKNQKDFRFIENLNLLSYK